MDAAPLPDASNLFGSLDTTLPPERVARLFAHRGWEVRKCSWTEYELTCEIAELILAPRADGTPGSLLLHGAVADVAVNLSRIAEPLARAGVRHSFECYNEQFQQIQMNAPPEDLRPSAD